MDSNLELIYSLKLTLSPALVATASQVQRRWGDAVGGWLVGLPLTSVPLTFFLALEHGPDFAAAAALGTLTGLISGAACCLGYALSARRHSPAISALVACATFTVSTLTLSTLQPSLLAAAIAVPLCIAIMLRAVPAATSPVRTGRAAPRSDVPLRIVTATAVILILTTSAAALGPHLTGLLSPFQVYAGILGIFTHRAVGGHAAVQVMRGTIAGSFAFAACFMTLVVCLRHHSSIPLAFTTAIASALIVQVAAFFLLPRGATKPEVEPT